MNLWEIIDNGNGTANVQMSPDEGLLGLPAEKALLIQAAVNKYSVMRLSSCAVYDNVIQLPLFTLEPECKEEQLSLWSLEAK